MTTNAGYDEIAIRVADLDRQQLPGQTAVPVPGYGTDQNAPGVEPHAETAIASTDHSAEQQPARPSRHRTKSRRKRRYTDIDSYQLEGLRSTTGDLLGCTVVIAEDALASPAATTPAGGGPSQAAQPPRSSTSEQAGPHQSAKKPSSTY
ncbi:hypothetical protein FHR84_004022 [Actinopolyspora biskrensis]|uniref:Uncharacterized protein n=1 Tax=Actinopolyspora biskrensis TaxID=1470178 RepID=A0A852ZAW0_9ACTN|nr:hypothetical protein [Actinopolyspora biskrensis]NYH80656.1 hypothetical protein [Actinopolyspora biskrensis]